MAPTVQENDDADKIFRTDADLCGLMTTTLLTPKKMARGGHEVAVRSNTGCPHKNCFAGLGFY